jgi:putative transcriptional regulator
MDLQHNFLLAMPGLAGDYFAHSLTYICEHNADGAMGIIVNRPSDMSLVELFTQIGLTSNHRWLDTMVLDGGPVAIERGLVLHSDDKVFASSAVIGQGLCLSTAMEVLDAIAREQAPDQFLVALGYAGWGPGQLEHEIANNVWLTIPGSKDVLFHPQVEQRLEFAAKSLGIDFRLISGRAGHA